ncbi:MAG TPA: FG-GAP-like repeat-containing protein, partial [Isosphaeraceae bacterium]|nr:FG-GAP-like repeat-containing protein [Isosphaeraceae bacterium]
MLKLGGRPGLHRWWLAAALLVATFGLVALWRSRVAPLATWPEIQRDIERERWSAAEPKLRKWLAWHPDDDRARIRLGGVLIVTDRLDEALEVLGKVRGTPAARERALSLTGEVHIKRHDAAAAERALRAACELGPTAVEPRRRLSYLLMLELRNEEVRPVLWELYKLTGEPRHVLTILGLAVSEPDARDPSPELDRFLERTPDDPLLERAQGLRLLRLGRPGEAIPHLEAALPLLDNDPTGRLALAECRILIGKLESIESVLGPEPAAPAAPADAAGDESPPRKSTSAESTSKDSAGSGASERSRWWLLHGQVEEARGHADLALAAWRNAAQIDPSSRSAQYRLGQALVHQGDSAAARAFLDRAEAIRLREVNLILAMDRYLRGTPGADLLEQLATLSRQAGLLPEASAWYEQVIRLDPSSLTAQKALAELAGAVAPPNPPPLRLRSGAIATRLAKTPESQTLNASRLRFEEVADRVGLSFHYRSWANGNLFIGDTMGGGVGLFDYDADGWLDVYCVGGCPLPYDEVHPPAPNRLFHNKGNGTFEDVTGHAGVGGRGYGMGCAVGDYDNDGHDDLFVTGLGATVLYRNRGDGTFDDVTQRAGVSSTRWTTAAGFADLDSDGDLDLVVIAYVEADPRNPVTCKDPLGHSIHCPPGHFPPQHDLLFRNNGDGTFTDASRDAGLQAGGSADLGSHNGPGLGLAIADLHGGGRLDLFVANDATPNFL